MDSNGQVKFERQGALVEVTIDHPDMRGNVGAEYAITLLAAAGGRR